MATKKLDIGLRQARVLCRMSHERRLAFLAEGLPIILASAQGFWQAAGRLEDSPREAEVLGGFAEEEAAKILILMDAVRCPASLVPSKMGKIVRWFYDHLARLIYADAVTWRPMDVTQLREYVDRHRATHYVEGFVGEYIMPNWNVYQRESRLYADIESYEDDEPGWNSPISTTLPFSTVVPKALTVGEAMSSLGIFTLPGLCATSEIWRQLAFRDTEDHSDAIRLTEQLLGRLVEEKVPTDAATQEHVDALYDRWQLPMYDFDLSPIQVPLDELQEQQDRMLWSEIGDAY